MKPNQRSNESFGGRRCSIQFKIILSFFALVASTWAQERVGDFCVNDEGDDGTCLPLLQCPSMVADPKIFNGAGPDTPNLCFYGDRGAIVCCAPEASSRAGAAVTNVGEGRRAPTPGGRGNVPVSTAEKTSLRKSEQMCQEYVKTVDDAHRRLNGRSCFLPQTVPLIVGGGETSSGEYPHMAALGYNKKGKVEWLCGGSLISTRYILTAAHCSRLQNAVVVVARLGELQIRNTLLTSLSKELQSRAGIGGDYPVDKVIRHPDHKFTSVYNDIALARLAEPLNNFDKLVRPACLYTGPDDNSFKKARATGWGNTQNGGDEIELRSLLQVDLHMFDKDYCNSRYKAEAMTAKLGKGVIDSMLCAGDPVGGKDTCQGDSGGPLQIKDTNNPCIFRIVGVTSFGKFCGDPNSPAIYSRVASFVPWIESVVWPD